MLTPIRADWAANCISAALMSGRRRSRSAGMSTMTSSSACGITSLPAAISGNGPGALASNALSAFCVWRCTPSSWGMVASVPRYWAFACCTSSSDSVPPLNSRSAISRLRFCSAAFSRAITSLASTVRIEQ